MIHVTHHQTAPADSNVRRTERIFAEREDIITQVHREPHTHLLRIKKVSSEAKSRYMTQLRVTPLYRR